MAPSSARRRLSRKSNGIGARCIRTALMLLSLIVALILDIFPLHPSVLWLKPDWVLVVLCAWVLAYPRLINIVGAFFIGLLVDVLQHSLLGTHGLAMAVICYFLLTFHHRLRRANFIKQTLAIFVLVMLYQVMIYCLQGIVGYAPASMMYWLAPFVAAFVWMIGSFILKMRR
jgi:rod shape-determining protein MreD